MITNELNRFNKLYLQHLNELTLQGKSPRTIEMYSQLTGKRGKGEKGKRVRFIFRC